MELPWPAVLRFSGCQVTEFSEWRDAPSADFAVIGDPVEHSRSPRMHQAAYAALDLGYRYAAIRVDSGEVGSALDHLAAIGYRGANVTVPHKQAALACAAKPDQLSLRIGAANTLDFRDGSATNTDAPGFAHVVGATMGAVPARALVLGAGGSSRAICVALTDMGSNVSIWNRTPANAASLADEFNLNVVDRPAVCGFDLVVNATSASLGAAPLPIDWSKPMPEATAIDLVYGDTAFLDSAIGAGMSAVDGLPLLVEQGALSFEWWFGTAAPRSAMAEAAR
jgi:shikimate dehydrogenase